MTARTGTTRPLTEMRNRWFMRNLPFPVSFARLLAQMPVDHIFGKFHAPEFHDLRVLFGATIEGHADLPWSREHIGVLDGGFVEEMVGACRGVSFDHVQGVAMEIP